MQGVDITTYVSWID